MYRYHIVMLVPGLEIYPGCLSDKSLGGSETAAACMAEELGKLGHKVFLFCNTPKDAEAGNVRYLTIDKFASFAGNVPHDITVIQRLPRGAASQFQSKLVCLWMHDLALGRAKDEFQACLWNVDYVAVLSRFMREQYQKVYAPPAGVLWVTRNGIDLEMFQVVHGAVRDRHKLMYCARPERGLDRLLTDIFPKILQREPKATLYIAGYDNKVEHLADLYARLGRLMNHPRIINLGPLNKRDLYAHYASSGCYVYPTPSPELKTFREISCITLMECMAAGLPVVATAVGAIPETLSAEAGSLIPEGDDEGFVNAVVSYMHDDIAFERASSAGKAAAQSLSWKSVAAEWCAEFQRRIRANNGDTRRLAQHFIRRSDIMAAKVLDHPSERARIASGWGFIDNGYVAHYEKIGLTHTDVYESAGHESRLKAAIQWLGSNPELTKILDVGCAHGAYAIHMSNALPGTRIDGVDCDRHSIRWANEYKAKHAKYPGNLQFSLSSTAGREYDCLFACEVLEHVADPSVFIQEWEGKIKAGGKAYITVPSGPWEHMSYRTYPYRCHVWEYDHHDIDDLFGLKKDLNVAYLAGGVSGPTGEPLGWHVISYTVGGPTGRIDMDRKLWLQRPRQSVSASIIAGGESVGQTIGWMLESIRDLVDEIVIADTGMKEDAKRIALDAGARIVPGSDPLESGFDVPRNQALDACISDWVLWIDSDERLLGAENLTKFLRENCWNGYGIRQHHFSIDAGFAPDMPVRLYRRKPGPQSEGRTMRHFGCVAGETLIDTPAGPIAIRDLVGATPWVYAYDASSDRLTVAKAAKVWKTHDNARIIAIDLDDGTTVRTTPDHRFLMRHGWAGTGLFREAQELVVGDRLMPVYRRPDGGHGLYNVIRVATREYRREHVFVYECVNGPVPEGFCVHHKDHDRANNDPSNLEVMTPAQHASHHHKGKVLSAGTRALVAANHAPCDGERNSMFGRKHSADTKNLIGKSSRDRNAGYGKSEAGWFTTDRAAKMNKASWADPAIRAKRMAGIKSYHEQQRADNHTVVAIRDGGYTDVYDMEVPGPRTFIAGGVAVHNSIHEHPELGLNNGPGPIIVLSDVHIAHLGYVNEAVRQKRYWRNLPLLKKDIEAYPERKIQKHFICRDNILLAKYHLMQNGGRVTDAVKELCRETVFLYRQHFMGVPGLVNIDTLQYYSDALRILGEGFDMKFSISAEAAGKMNGEGTRFQNMEDALKELTWRAEDAIRPLDDVGW